MSGTYAPDLFPAPSPPPSTISPTVWPGVSPTSTAALQRVLKDNHQMWHIFLNDKGFHNHAAHHAIAIWALGAQEAVIEAGYKVDSSYQRPAYKSPEPITVQNFPDHLGDARYYDAYLTFFADTLRQKGTAASLEEYVFSQQANFDPARDAEGKSQPEMLNRFINGLLHPLIHTGYGVEFGLPGMVVEGLAQAALHGSKSSAIIPASLFKPNSVVDEISSRLTSLLALENVALSPRSPPTGTHALSILARILKDPQFNGRKKMDQLHTYEDVMQKHSDALLKYANEWTLDTSDPKEVERKIEELVWANVSIYGLGGWKEGADFNADFFHMHLVTSLVFLPSLTAYLRPSSQLLLLRTYFTTCLAWWVSRGRPGFDIPGFFASDTAHPTPSGPLPTPYDGTLPFPKSPEAVTPNPWLPIIQTTIVHADAHLPKLQRALAHFAKLYGSRVAGLSDFTGTELEGAEKLDGTIFIRTAGLTAKRMGRVRDGEKPAKSWDQEGF